MRCVPSDFPLTTTNWHENVPECWKVSVKVSGGPASRRYSLGPKANIGAAWTCKVRTVEVRLTEERKNNRHNNKSLLFIGTSRENPTPGRLSCCGMTIKSIWSHATSDHAHSTNWPFSKQN